MDAKEDSNEAEPFALRDLNPAQDVKYHSRLDMETKMRRRAYEMLLLNGNRRLKKLDGLEVDREILVKQDAIWQEVLTLGLVKDIFHEQSLRGGELAADADPIEREAQAPEIRIQPASRPSTARPKQFTPKPRHAEVHTVLNPTCPLLTAKSTSARRVRMRMKVVQRRIRRMRRARLGDRKV